MEISIAGRHFAMGTSLQSYVHEKILVLINKYFKNDTQTNVNFVKDDFQYKCNIALNDLEHKNFITSDAFAHKVYECFDLALSKLEKQLKKYRSKFKIKNRVKLLVDG